MNSLGSLRRGGLHIWLHRDPASENGYSLSCMMETRWAACQRLRNPLCDASVQIRAYATSAVMARVHAGILLERPISLVETLPLARVVATMLRSRSLRKKYAADNQSADSERCVPSRTPGPMSARSSVPPPILGIFCQSRALGREPVELRHSKAWLGTGWRHRETQRCTA
jgi:hypothetical protein